jgi:glycosyltransferase involved in cell wall biosynthesis
MALLGRELARRGHRVTFVVSARDGLSDRDLRLVPVRLRADLPRGLGKVVNTSRLWRGLAETGADWYVMRGADTQALDLALYARARGARFAFMAASDDDFALRAFHTDRARNVLYRQGLRMADAVVVQTDRQRRLARTQGRRDAVVVPNPVEIPAEPPPPGDAILWAGMLRSYKRPEAVLSLARALPRLRFLVVGGVPEGAGGAEAAAAQAFLREAARVPNLACEGPQRPERMDRYYARAAVVINTSPVEGFPNVLLEGWARARPAVTAGVDPDEVICRHALGIHAKGIREMAEALEALMGDAARRRRLGENARRYVEAHHAVGPVVDRFEEVLRAAAARRRPT